MDGYEKLLGDICDIVDQMNGLRDIAYKHYATLVADVIADQITDIKAIEKIMDGLCDFGDEKRFLDLYRSLCRHVYYRYPEIVGEHVALFRMQWMTKDDELE